MESNRTCTLFPCTAFFPSAGTPQPAVKGNAAGAAGAGAATRLGAGQAERPAQHVEQAVGGIAEELGAVAVDGGGDVGLRHGQFPPARSAARSAAIVAVRRSSTAATRVRDRKSTRLNSSH